MGGMRGHKAPILMKEADVILILGSSFTTPMLEILMIVTIKILR